MFLLYPCLLSGGLVLAAPEATEDLQVASLLWFTRSASPHHLLYIAPLKVFCVYSLQLYTVYCKESTII